MDGVHHVSKHVTSDIKCNSMIGIKFFTNMLVEDELLCFVLLGAAPIPYVRAAIFNLPHP